MNHPDHSLLRSTLVVLRRGALLGTSAFVLTACGPGGGTPAPVDEAPRDSRSAPTAERAPVRSATPPTERAPSRAVVAAGQLGRITQIDTVKSPRQPANGVGAVVGGVIGGLLGNQVGGGTGKDAATVVGAVGGAIAGNNIQKNLERDIIGYRLHIALDSGQSQEVVVPSRGTWQPGDRVRVHEGAVQPA